MFHPAVVNYANKKEAVELREIQTPPIGDDDVLLQVRAVGVCGTDLHQWQAVHNWPIWERVLELLATGQLDLDPIIGGLWPLEEWHNAFETMYSAQIVKSVLIPKA